MFNLLRRIWNWVWVIEPEPPIDWLPVLPEPIITLPLDVVAVTASMDMEYLWKVKRAIIKAQDWWLEQVGIRLQPVLSTTSSKMVFDAFRAGDNHFIEPYHYATARGAMLTAYVVDAPALKGDLWGTSVGYHGFVVVVGQQEQLIGPLIAHELGHVFFADSLHEPGTFMRLETLPRNFAQDVTFAQRKKMREAALRTGGR